MEEPDERQRRVTFRLPRDLHEKLLVAASSDARTLNAEVVARLEASFSPNEMLEVQRALITSQQSGQLYLAGHLLEAIDLIVSLTNDAEALRKWRIVQKAAEETVRSFEDRLSRVLEGSEDRAPERPLRFVLPSATRAASGRSADRKRLKADEGDGG